LKRMEEAWRTLAPRAGHLDNKRMFNKKAALVRRLIFRSSLANVDQRADSSQLVAFHPELAGGHGTATMLVIQRRGGGA